MAIKLPLGETDPAYWNLHPAYVYDPTDDSFRDPMGTKTPRILLHYRREQQMCGHAGGSHNWQQTQLRAQASAAQLQMLAMAQSQANLGALGGLGGGSGGTLPTNWTTPTGWTTVPIAAAGASAPHDKWTTPSETMVVGEILGWRAWKVATSRIERGSLSMGPQVSVIAPALLASMAADYYWQPKQIAKGDVLRGFGIHAYKDRYGPAFDNYASGDCVIGQVAMWGEVIEHKHGYRSQYAKVHSLDHWSRSVLDEVRKEIETAYL